MNCVWPLLSWQIVWLYQRAYLFVKELASSCTEIKLQRGCAGTAIVNCMHLGTKHPIWASIVRIPNYLCTAEKITQKDKQLGTFCQIFVTNHANYVITRYYTWSVNFQYCEHNRVMAKLQKSFKRPVCIMNMTVNAYRFVHQTIDTR